MGDGRNDETESSVRPLRRAARAGRAGKLAPDQKGNVAFYQIPACTDNPLGVKIGYKLVK